MAISLGTATALGAGLDFVGGLLGKGGSNKEAARQADRAWKHARDQFEQGIQYRVKDARKAGIHPLFALGGAGAATSGYTGSAAFTQTGSAAGDAMRAAGRGLTEYARVKGQQSLLKDQSSLIAAQIRATDAAAAKDNASAMAIASEAKRAEQRALTARTYPLPSSGDFLRTPLAGGGSRKRQVDPDVDAPLWWTAVGQDGQQFHVPNVDVVGEEILSPQMFSLMYQLAKRKVGKAWSWSKKVGERQKKAFDAWARTARGRATIEGQRRHPGLHGYRR